MIAVVEQRAFRDSAAPSVRGLATRAHLHGSARRAQPAAASSWQTRASDSVMMYI